MTFRGLRAAAGLAATALVLSACGGDDAGGNGGGGGGEGGDYRIGVSFYSSTIPLYVEMEEGMREKAEELGAELEFAYADNNAENQANQINTFITTGVDLILASPVDAAALAPAYQEADAAGIPVISVANQLQDESLEDAFVGADWAELAAQTMERVAEGMGGSGQLLQVTGPPQIAFVQAQMAGWEQALGQYPDIQVVDTVAVPDLSTSGALDATTSALAANPGVTGIIASNDDIALGAIQAVEAAGIPHDQIFIGAWDGTDAALEAIRAGKYDLTLSLKAYSWGELAVETAVDWLDGERPDGHRVDVEYIFIDQQNVDDLTEEELR